MMEPNFFGHLLWQSVCTTLIDSSLIFVVIHIFGSLPVSVKRAVIRATHTHPSSFFSSIGEPPYCWHDPFNGEPNQPQKCHCHYSEKNDQIGII